LTLAAPHTRHAAGARRATPAGQLTSRTTTIPHSVSSVLLTA
jgi:hypothetical protein